MLPEKDAYMATSSLLPTTTLLTLSTSSLPSLSSSSSSSSPAANSTQATSGTEQVKIARPPARQVASYSCPYIHPAKTAATSAGPSASASGRPTCGLLKPLDKQDESDSVDEGSILSVSLHSLDGCVIARETYLGSRNEIMYRCGLSCGTDGSGSDDTVSGLEDGWKWQCN